MLKRMIALACAAVLLLATPALADITVLSERLYVVDDADGPWAYYFCVVRNDGSELMDMGKLTLEIYDQDRQPIFEDSAYSGRMWLAPGEVTCYVEGYVSLGGAVSEGRWPASFGSSIEASPSSYGDAEKTVPCSVTWNMKRTNYDNTAIDTTITNTLSYAMSYPKTEVYLTDDAGHVVLAAYGIDGIRIPSGQTIIQRITISQDLLQVVLDSGQTFSHIYACAY